MFVCLYLLLYQVLSSMHSIQLLLGLPLSHLQHIHSTPLFLLFLCLIVLLLNSPCPPLPLTTCLCLQWRYVAANNWGICEDGSGQVGCGPQEEFRACADVAISGSTGLAFLPSSSSLPIHPSHTPSRYTLLIITLLRYTPQLRLSYKYNFNPLFFAPFLLYSHQFIFG